MALFLLGVRGRCKLTHVLCLQLDKNSKMIEILSNSSLGREREKGERS